MNRLNKMKSGISYKGWFPCFQRISISELTVKPVLVATSIKQATSIKKPVVWFPIQTINKFKFTFIKQAPASSKHFSIIP